ncbi:hypothetical protein JKF63_02392 [Porcisia hertigi]|uniref:Uncharacterized protein n=1 Tax=Porcisia hertigi TaxID=2761500 RepID=A0A836HNL0_9TRYP|nr:hypothetical protein JKF63_02392 [Porcisia hertigi]
MIRDQCHAYCKCSYCAQQPQEKSSNAGASMRAAMEALDRPGMSRDELYMKSLHQSLRAKAFLDSSKNASKFIPDEQLLSSTKRREAKELALAAELVPVRRRDRLQELVLLEHKNRLREEAALRAQRRALGLPDEEEEAVSAEKAESSAATRPSSQASLQQSSGSGAATPASRCSAEHDLHVMLKGIKNIVDEDPAVPSEPLYRGQVQKLRQLMHTQRKKTREMVDSCENAPHACGHCLDVQVQARHLSAAPEGSVAFGLTGKVINPEEGIKFGTDAPRDLNGTFNSAVDLARVSGKKSRLTSYKAGPSGTGVVFLPVLPQNAGSRYAPGGQSARFRASFNNNIGSGEPVEDELQFPGSTYNVYDLGLSKEATPQAMVKAGGAERTGRVDSAASNSSLQNGNKEPKADALITAPAAAEQPTYSTSVAMWRTTNQEREMDMERFMEFQKKMKANSKRVYAETASRLAKPAAA